MLHDILSEFAGEDNAVSKMQLLIKYARMLPTMPDSEKTAANRVMGCTTQVTSWFMPYQCQNITGLGAVVRQAASGYLLLSRWLAMHGDGCPPHIGNVLDVPFAALVRHRMLLQRLLVRRSIPHRIDALL
jgi:hypothetical protein